MAKITEEMKGVVAKTKGFAVATATKDGDPHVIPVGFAKVLSDEEILLMDVFMKMTVENIKANPKVAVSVWDMAGMKGYEFKGDARIESSGNIYDEGVKWVKAVMPDFPVTPKAAVVVKVISVYETSPGPNAGRKVD